MYDIENIGLLHIWVFKFYWILFWFYSIWLLLLAAIQTLDVSREYSQKNYLGNENIFVKAFAGENCRKLQKYVEITQTKIFLYFSTNQIKCIDNILIRCNAIIILLVVGMWLRGLDDPKLIFVCLNWSLFNLVSLCWWLQYLGMWKTGDKLSKTKGHSKKMHQLFGWS